MSASEGAHELSHIIPNSSQVNLLSRCLAMQMPSFQVYLLTPWKIDAPLSVICLGGCVCTLQLCVPPVGLGCRFRSGWNLLTCL